VFKVNEMITYNFNCKIIFYATSFLIINLIILPGNSFSNTNKPKVSINGSGLKIPRMVSLKNSLTFMRSGPGKEFPINFELKQKGYPLKVTAEFNNWRKVITFSKTSGWIHTQLLSSIRTGLIIKTTFLKSIPSNLGNPKAKLLPNLLVKITNCNEKWCKIEIIKNKKFIGWVQKDTIWGSTRK